MNGRASWLLGAALGLFAGAAFTWAGLFVLLLVAAAALWARFERARPLGLGGLLVGVGAGMGGFLAYLNARCAASNAYASPDQQCVPADYTAWFVVSTVVALAGVFVTLARIARIRSRRA